MLANLLPRTDFASYDDFVRNYRVNLPEGFNYGFDVVDALAASDPDRLALVWCNDHGEERRLTMRDMATGSARAARFFRAHGIRKGDAVMLVLKRHYTYWYAVLGLHKLGAVAIPATHQLMRKDVAYRVRAANVKMIVSVNEPGIRTAIEEAMTDAPVAIRALLDGDGPGWIDFTQGIAREPGDFPRPEGPEAVAVRDPMLLYFTSGTTGQPKMVRHNFLYPLGHLVTAVYWQQCRPGGLHLTVAETGWAKASWGKLYGQWLAGSAVMVYDFDRFNAGRMLDVIARHRVTTFCAPPTVYRHLIHEPLRNYDWSHVRHAVVAGEPLNPEVFEQFQAATGLALHEGYGQTEMTVALATFPWMKPKPGSMGRPAPGYAVDLLDAEGRSCPDDQEGEIVLRTDRQVPLGMFDGYHAEPERTHAVWHDGIYHTGDVAWRDADGYFWFVGRTDDVIKSSGYRIGPFEVESALQEHPAVLECAVTGVPDPDRGAVVKASVVLAVGHTPSEALSRELQDHVKRTTAPYKYPRIVEFVVELPKTISGKIRRMEIRARDRHARPEHPLQP